MAEVMGYVQLESRMMTAPACPVHLKPQIKTDPAYSVQAGAAGQPGQDQGPPPPGAGGPGGPSGGPSAGGAGDNVVDAEFTDSSDK